MTPAELKKLIAARQRGEEAPLLDRLAPPIRYELRPLDHPHRKLKYTAAEVMAIFSIVDYDNIN